MDPGYLELLNSLPNLDYPVLWRVFLLTVMRIAPIMGMAPFLGAKLVPVSTRMGFALMLAIIFFPTAVTYLQGTTITDSDFILYSAKELIIGFVFGYFSSIPFILVQSSGILIDYLRGSSMFMSQDPSLQTQASPIGVMFNYYLIALFFAIDGPFIFLSAIESSFQTFPINSVVNPAFFNLQNSFWQTSIAIVGRIFSLSIQLAAPSIVAILMAEMFLGIANRLAPQVQIAFLGMSLKSLLGLLLLWAAWFLILNQMSSVSLDWMHTIQKEVLTLPFTK